MSDQAAPPAAQGEPSLHQATGPSAAKLHDSAVKAEKELEALATGLAQAGADPGAVKAVTQMADVVRKMVGMMAKQAQAEQPEAAKPTISSATDDMMAARPAAQPAPTQ